MQGEWRKDDAALDSGGQVYRRVKRCPSHYVHPDPVTGTPIVGNAALRYQLDGMSVTLGQIMATEDLDVSDLCKWDDYTVVRFLVKDVRHLLGGVVASVDAEDSNAKRGLSHGLVRTANPPPDKDAWAEFRDGLRRIMTVRVARDSDWCATN